MRRQYALAAAAVAAAVGLVAAAPALSSFAAGSAHPHSAVRAIDNDDNLVPASRAITATSDKVVFTATVNSVAVTITCTTSTFKFTTPATGLGPINLTGVPTFGGCTDNLSGTDTVTANATNGAWTLLFLDSRAAGEETQAEPNTGDKLEFTMPKACLTASSTILAGCVVTAAPAAPASLKAKYNDKDKAEFANDAFPVAGAGCTTGATADITATYAMAPHFTDVS
jgi:hypothetical protein